MNTPLPPFAAILESQASPLRLGLGGVLGGAAYIALLVAGIAMGGRAVTRLVEPAPSSLVVMLVDDVPAVVEAPVAEGGDVAVAPPAQGKAVGVAKVRAVVKAQEESLPPTAAAVGSVDAAAVGGSAATVPPANASIASASTGTGDGGGDRRAVGVMAFEDGMTRPRLIEMVEPELPREARDADVKGLFLAKCVITTAGTLQNCRLIKGHPLVNQALLTALSRWRYTPVIYQGKPVAVDYVIQVRLAGRD